MNVAVNLVRENKDNILLLWEKYTLQPADESVDFFESGGDSLGAINLIIELQKLYRVEINLENFMRNPNIGFLCAVIAKDNKVNE